MKKLTGGFIISAALSISLIMASALNSFADTVTIIDDGTRIRSDSSTSSNVVINASKGQSYEITDTVTGSDGNTWYKIQVNDSSTGYVRGDLVNVASSAGADNGVASSEPTEVTSALPATEVVPLSATINQNGVNIREGAGTDYAKVRALDSGTTVTIVAEATDSSGSTWYKINCDNPAAEGYVRNDFVTLQGEITYPGDENTGEITSENTDEVAELEITEEPQGGDYEVVYTTDDDGVYQYYLYDHINNTKQKVPELLAAVEKFKEGYTNAKKSLTLFKILTIVFGALMVVAIALAVFFFLRARNGYEEEYYEEDEEEQEEDKKSRRPAPETGSQKERRVRPEGAAGQGRTVSDGRTSERSANRRPERGSEDKPREVRRPRRPQNFLADDDEFEFEFLDMDE